MITLRNVSKSYAGPRAQRATVLHDLSLDIGRGETLCLVGTSGCGKTTTLKLINRLLDPDAGAVLLDGTDTRTLDLVTLRRRMGYVIQSAGLFPHMTVAENIGLLCRLENWPQERTAARVRALLSLVNLDPDTHSDRHPGALSGGQRQRVGVARALALDPPVLLMDEPFSAVDPITRAQLHEEFLSLRKTLGRAETTTLPGTPPATERTIVIVTHDLHEAFKLGDRIALMDRGRLLQVGTPEDLRARPADPFVTQFLRAQGHA